MREKFEPLLRKAGVTNPFHREAILANMYVESKGDPSAVNPKSGAVGLMQWLGARKPKDMSL
jgi:soluble lytic murein transglycosylase-like protein